MGGSETTDLTPRQKRRLILAFAIGLAVVAVGSALFAVVVLGREAQRLDALPLLRPGAAPTIAVGTKVLLTGTIRADNPHLVRTLVVGCQQSQPSAGESWRGGRTFNQPVRLNHGGALVVATLQQPCPRGTYKTIPDPESSMRRWIGYQRGQPLTVVGTVAARRPLRLRVEADFGGDVAAYRRYLSRARWYVLPFSGVMLLLAGLLWLASRGRA